MAEYKQPKQIPSFDVNTGRPGGAQDVNMSVGNINRMGYPGAKTEGIKIRGTGAATKGTKARGPMA